MLKILAADLLICDVLVPPQALAACAPFIAAYNTSHPESPVVPGSKSPLTREEFLALSACVPSSAHRFPGGSSANAMSLLSRLMGEHIHVDFIGAAGADRYGDVIARSLAQDGFYMQGGIVPNVETAVSFVLVGEGGDRSILTYAGTSRDHITQHIDPAQSMVQADILFLQGSLWPKFGEAFAGALTAARAQQHKRLWFALPTHSKLGHGHQRMFSDIIPTAEIVLANADELRRIYGEDDVSAALADLQQAFSGSTIAGQCAFITDAAAGATIVTKDGMQHVPAAIVDKASRVNTLGAGDAAFAGFLYGRLNNKSDEESARIAMCLAAETLKIPEARLGDPKVCIF